MLSKVIYMRSEYVVIKGKVTFEHIFRKKIKKKCGTLLSTKNIRGGYFCNT